jgi:pyruvate formate lyase activating enzyme
VKQTIKEALLYQPLADSRVRCTACARYCNIPEGKVGLCGVRQNIGGKLQLLVYGKVITGHIDPIEKKPVVHYMPGSKIFSIATTGCNWLCHPAGAEILLSNGDKKPVEELLPGDSLWSYDIDNGMNIHPNVVTRTGSRFARIWDLRYGARGAGHLSLTAEHPVMTDSGWKSAEKVAPGEKILKVWYQNTKDWKRKRPGSIQRAVFNCTRCGASVKGIDNWNRHRGSCYTEGMGMSPEVRERYRKRMISDNPMKDPDVARRAVGASKQRFLQDPSHGWHRNSERLRIWLHRHPSESQKQLYALLDEMGLEYDQEYRIQPELRQPESRATYIADAAFPDTKLDIEVDGGWHYKHEPTRDRDIVRDRTLRANGWQVLRISGRHLYAHREEVKALIVQHLAAPVMLNKRTWVEVKSATPTEHFEPVYSFECIPNHNYVGDGIILHNCSYCQNFDISQRRKVEGTDLMPPDVVSLALSHGCQGIAYTYNQPTIFMEFARDIGVEARKNGLINIFVSNGFDTPDTVAMMDDFLDCITVDFKGSGETNFVRKHIGIPDAQPIFQTIQEIKGRGKTHIEITDLIVPEIGDNLDEARKLSRWLYDNLGPDVPVHFLRFHPDYKLMHLPSTPVKTLEVHCRVAREEGLRYVYVGNVTGHPWEHTYCPECKNIAIKRYGFDITGWNLDDKNRCVNCGYQLPIFGQLSSSVSEDRYLPVVN